MNQRKILPAIAAAVRGEKTLTASLDEELLVAETVLRASAMP